MHEVYLSHLNSPCLCDMSLFSGALNKKVLLAGYDI
jgi:hypothetical protein